MAKTGPLAVSVFVLAAIPVWSQQPGVPPTASAYIARAQLHIAADDSAGALADYAAAAALDPDDGDLLALRAQLELALHLYPDAIADLGRAVALEPAKIAYRDERAFAEEFNGDYRAAIADLTAAIAVFPEPERYRRRLQLELKLGDLAAAAAAADDALLQQLIRQPDDVLLARSASARFTVGDLAGALADLNLAVAAALDHDPANAPAALAQRADGEARNHNTAAAIEDCNHALALLARQDLQPPAVHTEVATLKLRGELKEASADFPGAIADFSLALSLLNPAAAAGLAAALYSDRAGAERAQGDIAAAAADEARARSLVP